MGLQVTRSLTIPDRELKVSFSPSGGPGGQHANRSSTRVTLEWNVAESSALGPRQKARLLRVLDHRLDSNGTLRVTSDARRSQLRNRVDAEERLARLVARALTPPKDRVATQPTVASRRKRVESKRRRGQIKRLRTRPTDD
ncbi:MAG TPA: alternative ribosome rescue aminoacyl-tRNA hydrolase ArfB [Actinomycetota bacterium]|nr:alternative ribosome rescue aminoacyl-tRNA hydrolase ArfB [Actinomycetota bacterium]